MKTGKALIRDINECNLKKGECALWWLGQHGFIVKLGNRVLYFDPFLSRHKKRRIQPLLAPEDVTNADLKTIVCKYGQRLIINSLTAK